MVTVRDLERLIAPQSPEPIRKNPNYFLQLKITLRTDTEHPVWRRVWIRGSCNFKTLHDRIQKTLGWSGDQGYVYEIGEPVPIPRFTLTSPADFMEMQETFPQLMMDGDMRLLDCFQEYEKIVYIYGNSEKTHFDIQWEADVKAVPKDVPTGEGEVPAETITRRASEIAFMKLFKEFLAKDPKYRKTSGSKPVKSVRRSRKV